MRQTPRVGIQKAELKKLILFEQGKRFEDLIEGVERDQHRSEGATIALSHASKGIQALVNLVDDDVSKERYGLEEAVRIKEYIGRAVQVCVDMARQQEQQKLAYLGKAEGIRDVVKIVKTEYDKQVARVEELREAEAAGESADPKTRVPGQPPAFRPFADPEPAKPAEPPPTTAEKRRQKRNTSHAENA